VRRRLRGVLAGVQRLSTKGPGADLETRIGGATGDSASGKLKGEDTSWWDSRKPRLRDEDGVANGADEERLGVAESAAANATLASEMGRVIAAGIRDVRLAGYVAASLTRHVPAMRSSSAIFSEARTRGYKN
jgi:hypothetical protein